MCREAIPTSTDRDELRKRSRKTDQGRKLDEDRHWQRDKQTRTHTESISVTKKLSGAAHLRLWLGSEHDGLFDKIFSCTKLPLAQPIPIESCSVHAWDQRKMMGRENWKKLVANWSLVRFSCNKQMNRYKDSSNDTIANHNPPSTTVSLVGMFTFLRTPNFSPRLDVFIFSAI